MAAIDRIQLSIIGYHPQGMQMVNVLDYALADGGDFDATPAQLKVFAEDWATNSLSSYLDCCGGDYTLDRFEVKGFLDNAVVVAVEDPDEAGSVGSSLEPSGPAERCILIIKKAAVAGAAGRGRIFLPMPPASAYDSAGRLELGSVEVIAAVNLCGVLIDSFSIGLEATVVPVIAHRAGGVSPIVDFSVPYLVGIQRNRRFGIGA